MMFDGRMASRAAVMAVLASSLCFSGVSQGQTFYSNILSYYFGQSGFSSSIPLASSFTTGFQPIAVTAILVNVQHNHGSETMTVSLCQNSNGVPSTRCVPFNQGGSLPTAFTTVPYWHSAVNLLPYSTYWVKLTTTAPRSIPPPFAWGTVSGSGAMQYTSTGWYGLNGAAFQMEIQGYVVPILPDPPAGVTATAGNGQAQVSWSAPPTDGGAAIAGYVATASPGGETCLADSSMTNCTVTGLTNGTLYTFTVTSSNAVGTSEPSQPSPAVIPSVFDAAGQCGTANDVVTNTEPPPATLCLVGQSQNLTALSDGRYTWTCVGLGAGTSESCSTSNGNPDQAALTLTAKKNVIRMGGSTVLTAQGGSGKGGVHFTVTAEYGARCTKVSKTGNKLTLKGSYNPGVCTVTASKWSDGNYNLQTSNTVSITVTP